MDFKFKKGDEVFISSRKEGIKRVKICRQIDYNGQPCYKLNQLIIYHKDGHKVGSGRFKRVKDVVEIPLWISGWTEMPCPESWLFQVGDYIQDPTANLWGTPPQEVFTQEMADQIL